MPVICRNRHSGEIAAGFMKNIYEFTYFGAWWWDSLQNAQSVHVADLHRLGVENSGDWDLIEIADDKLKLLNVKLNNDPRRKLIMDKDGTIKVLK